MIRRQLQWLVAVILLAGIFAPSTDSQFMNRALIYNQRSNRGNFIPLVASQYPDLGLLQFTQSYSTCVSGTWLFYQNPGFDPRETGYVEWFTSTNGQMYCLDFRKIGGKVLSARFVGDAKKYQRDTLNLYAGLSFRSTNEYSDRDMPNLLYVANKVSSLIVTGHSPWTVYPSTNFRGRGVCVRPGRDGNANFIPDVGSLGFQRGAIQSARRGC